MIDLRVQVQIYHDGRLIGQSEISASDPPMGVAMGSFEPSADYDPGIHAGELDGVSRPGATLVVRSIEHGLIDCVGVFIQDWNESLGERHVSVLGIPYPKYKTWFGEDPAYRAYYKTA